MAKPIIWTVIAAIVIALTLMSGYTGIWAYVMILTAGACAVIQWMVWKKFK